MAETTELKKSDFYFDLPQELIAQDPLEDRSSSRLLVLDKNTGEISHHIFRDIIDYLHPGDCLVLNNTKVIPARLLGEREGTGGHVEVLLLKRKEADVWETLVKPGKKCKRLTFGDGLLKAEVLETVEEGNRLIRFEYEGIFEEVLDKLGEMPLPPYITHKLKDKNRYQTVYAKYEGSAAAPTAGLHFTQELLQQIADKGIKIAYVTLHVGLGTFRPVKEENVLEHHMHSEYYQVTEEAAVGQLPAQKEELHGRHAGFGKQCADNRTHGAHARDEKTVDKQVDGGTGEHAAQHDAITPLRQYPLGAHHIGKTDEQQREAQRYHQNA